ncbi:hypothetical protein HLB02_20540 [Serratia nevei]|nr:hypothetical protein [Serratia nevei]
MCLATPFISSGIKEVHTRAIWWNKRIEFKNDNYSEDLAEERRLKLIEKQNKASKLESEIENSNRRLSNLNDLYRTLNENSTKLSSQESSLLAEIASKRDELQKLEIQIAQENQEYSNFKSMKRSYNSLAQKNKSEKLKHQLEIEKTLGILKALIDGGYIPETVENTIIFQLNTIGIDIPTKNPLRKTQRRHAVAINKDGSNIEIISYSPAPIEIPSKNSLNNEWNQD